MQKGQRLGERQLLAIGLDPDARAQLFEQPRPRRVDDRAVIGEDAFLRLGQLVRPELARLLHRVPVLGRVRVRLQARGLLVAGLGQLEGEEHAVAAALSARLAHPGQQSTGGGIVRVLAVQQVGVYLGL